MDVNEIIAMRLYGEGLDNDGQYWSEQDKKTLLDRFDEGVGITELAIDFKRSETAIMQMLNKEKRFQFEVKSRNRNSCGSQCLCSRCFYYQVCPQSLRNQDKALVTESKQKEAGDEHV